ncbi:MAG: DUF2752 domain-containing protein [Verrucomicrobiota bacterium]
MHKKIFYGIVGIILLWGICWIAKCLLALPFPVCGFHEITGFPCPFCGGTRCLAAMGQFHFKDALLLHPLIFGCILLGIGFGIYRLFKKQRFTFSKNFYRLFFAVILVNWIYLMINNGIRAFLL